MVQPAQHLAIRGEHIILVGRHHDKLQHACQKLPTTGATVESLVLDITDEAQLERLARTLEPVDNIVVTVGSQAPRRINHPRFEDRKTGF